MIKSKTSEEEFLINGYCDLVNKLFYFIQSYFEGIVPAGHLEEGLYWKTKQAFELERVCLKEGRRDELTELLCDYLNLANEYLEQGRLWENSRNDRRVCRNTVLNCVQLVANLTVLLTPVAEGPAAQVSRILDLGEDWEMKCVHSGYELPWTETVASGSIQIGA